MNTLRRCQTILLSITKWPTAAAAALAPPAAPLALPTRTIHVQREPPSAAFLSSASLIAHGFSPDPISLPSLLRACASLGSSLLAHMLHQQAVVFGFHRDVYISSSLMHMYGKLGDARSARKLFDIVPHGNAIPWTAIIGAYSQAGNVGLAFSMYERMRLEGIEPNSVTILELLCGVKELQGLQCLHGSVIRNGLASYCSVANSAMNVYVKCGDISSARQVFDTMTRLDVISWNTLISGYSQEGDAEETVDLFKRMRASGVEPDNRTFASFVSAVTNSSRGLAVLSKSVHEQIISWGFDSDKCVRTTLVRMYLELRNFDDAFILFDQAMHKDAIFWTVMISGLVKNDRADEALRFFKRMLLSGETPVTTIVASVLAACAQLGSLKVGSSVHGYLVRQSIAVDIAAENSLLSMYAKCGHQTQCERVFSMMQDRDVVSWNAVIASYAQNGHLDDAFRFFSQMRDALLRPDSITLVLLLKVSASLGSLHHGKCTHGFLIRNQLTSANISVNTTLIDMYSKCGDLGYAQSCFNAMTEHDLVSWSTIIASYGNHGKGDVALTMYSDFLHTGTEPNHVIFLSVLNACSHAGLVLPGLTIFQSMVDDFWIEPGLEHFACLIDLLGRSGMLQEAFNFFGSMTQKPNADVLGILLDACRTHRNVKLGEEIAREIIALKPKTAANFVQLAHSYAVVNRWDEVGESWIRMRSLGLKKTPGWSSIQLNGVITTFFMEHTSHALHEELNVLLSILEMEMRESNPEMDVR